MQTVAPGTARHNRPRLGEIATLRADVDAEAFRIADAFAALFGDVEIEGHVEVTGVPNWYHVSHRAGIKVQGHIVSRGSKSPTVRQFYFLVDDEWVELTDRAQLA